MPRRRSAAEERSAFTDAAREQAMQFDRVNVFDRLFSRLRSANAAA